MLIQSRESAGSAAPSVPNTRHVQGMFSRGYYNPSFQISGAIEQAGPAPAVVGDNKFVLFFSKMNVREKPSISGAKTGKTTEINTPYAVVAASWSDAVDLVDQPIGQQDMKWLLLADPVDLTKQIGWACAAEYVKLANPRETLTVLYSIQTDVTDPLQPDELKLQQADKTSQVSAMNKWISANKPKPKAGEKKKPKVGADDVAGAAAGGASPLMYGGIAAVAVWLFFKNGGPR